MRTFKQYYNELTRKKKFVAQEYIFSTLSLIFVKTGHKKVSVYERFYGCLRTDPSVGNRCSRTQKNASRKHR